MAFKSITYARPVPALLLVAAVFFGAQTEVHADDSAANGAHTVLITGANRGLGLEFARQYKEAGWQVIGTARKPGEADDLEALDVQVVQLDVADQGSVDRMAAELMDQPIDLLINNAGIFPRVGKIDEIDFDDYKRTLSVNTIGPVRVTRALLPNLRQGKLKIVAGLSSNLGSIAENERGNFYGYRESKAALNIHRRHEGGTRQADAGRQRHLLVVRRQPDALVAAQNRVMIVTPVVSKSPIDVRAAIDSSRSIDRPMSLCGARSPAAIIASI